MESSVAEVYELVERRLGKAKAPDELRFVGTEDTVSDFRHQHAFDVYHIALTKPYAVSNAHKHSAKIHIVNAGDRVEIVR